MRSRVDLRFLPFFLYLIAHLQSLEFLSFPDSFEKPLCQILRLLNFILVRPHPADLLNKPPFLIFIIWLRLQTFDLSFVRFPHHSAAPLIHCSCHRLRFVAPCFIYLLLMMQRINENLIAWRHGALPPVGGFMCDATTVSRTPLPHHTPHTHTPPQPIDHDQ